MNPISLVPIGTVRSTRTEATDDDWDKEAARIELDASVFSPEALAGLTDFSHVEIIFHMDRIPPEKTEWSARHPRGNANWPKVGIFAQRTRARPNHVGATVCRVLRVEDLSLYVEGLDAIDGTPVLDIKPWMQEFGPRGETRQPVWAIELMRPYWRR